MLFGSLARPTYILIYFGLISATPRSAGSFDQRLVYAPKQTSPKAGDVWAVGTNVSITWELRVSGSNLTGVTTGPVLGIYNDGGLTAHPLFGASDLEDMFYLVPPDDLPLLTDLNVTFVMPTVPSGDNYAVYLFGDSGNFGPPFAIRNGDEPATTHVSTVSFSTHVAPSDTPTSPTVNDAGSTAKATATSVKRTSSHRPGVTSTRMKTHSSTSSSSASTKTSLASSSSFATTTGSSTSTFTSLPPTSGCIPTSRGPGFMLSCLELSLSMLVFSYI